MQKSKEYLDLSGGDLAELFGSTEEEIVSYCGDIIASLDFHYCKLEGEEREQLILTVLKLIDSEQLATAGQERQSDWEKGWSENLQEFIDSGYNIDKLVPRYFKKNVPVRLNRDYVMPVSEDFVLDVTRVFRSWLFQKYFQKADSIYEFGCGPAHHLAYLAALFPEKKLYGFDWATSSQEIIKLLSARFGWKISGYNFNFFDPDPNIQFDENSAVYTFGALEQVGSNHSAFLEFILKRTPAVCVNVEGLHELYDVDHLLDYLALKYHRKRNYLNGYLTELRNLESQRKIEIIKIHHQQFGNIYDDPHSYVIWKPTK